MSARSLTVCFLKAFFGDKIGVDGAKLLASALKTNQTINTINLNGNEIGDEGAKACALHPIPLPLWEGDADTSTYSLHVCFRVSCYLHSL